MSKRHSPFLFYTITGVVVCSTISAVAMESISPEQQTIFLQELEKRAPQVQIQNELKI